jgi:hypothetical protein
MLNRNSSQLDWGMKRPTPSEAFPAGPPYSSRSASIGHAAVIGLHRHFVAPGAAGEEAIGQPPKRA